MEKFGYGGRINFYIAKKFFHSMMAKRYNTMENKNKKLRSTIVYNMTKKIEKYNKCI